MRVKNNVYGDLYLVYLYLVYGECGLHNEL
jgi:hypothetical protein